MSRFAPALSALFFILAAVLAAGVSIRGDVAAAPTAAQASRTPPPAATTLASPTPLPPIPPGYRIQIPRLGIDLPILEGDIERDAVLLRTPENFAFHLPGTAIPGNGLNRYMHGGSQTGTGWISTPDGRAMRYVVTEVHPRVPPEDVQWAAPTPPDHLTLQTSTGPNPGDPRFVVIAQPG